MEQFLNTQGVKSHHISSDVYESYTSYHYDDELLKQNIIIETEMFLLNDSDFDYNLTISVKGYNKSNSWHCSFYNGEVLSPLQKYRVILDLYLFIKSINHSEIFEQINFNSESATYASLQEESSQLDLFISQQDDVERIKKLIQIGIENKD